MREQNETSFSHGISCAAFLLQLQLVNMIFFINFTLFIFLKLSTLRKNCYREPNYFF